MVWFLRRASKALGSFGASTCILWHFSLRIRGALAAIHTALMRITCAFATSVALAEFGLTSDARVCAQNAHRCATDAVRCSGMQAYSLGAGCVHSTCIQAAA